MMAPIGTMAFMLTGDTEHNLKAVPLAPLPRGFRESV
jgi:hypothetical protein